MADRERKGLVARWLEGKERSDDYVRSTLPTSRWALFWDILKGRFGRLMLVNLLVLITFLPIIAVYFWRYLTIMVQNATGPYGAGLMIGYPVIQTDYLMELAQWQVFQSDLLFFALFIVGSVIAAVGISGGMYIIRNLIWTEGIFVANDFLRGIKRNYWNVLEAVLFFTIILFLVQTMGNLADMYVVTDSSLKGWMIASKVVGYIILVLSAFISLWMISLGVNYKQGVWALFRNAVIMSVGTLPQTVVFAVVALLPFALLFFGSFFTLIGIVMLLLISFSYAMLVWMDYSQWAFDKFINPNIGVKVGRGLYNKNGKTEESVGSHEPSETESAAMREYRRMIVAQGKSKLVCRPIKPIDDGMEIYQLPESFSRDDLQRLKESKDKIEEDVKAYEDEHKDDEQYVEYNRQFEERERALAEEDGKKKKKPKHPPKMLNKR